MNGRDIAKTLARALATLAATPALLSYAVRSRLMGADLALEGSSQALALLPGLTGQYVRRAFLSRVLAECHPSATVEFGVIFSQAGCRIGPRAYVGPRCHLGLALIEADVMLAAGVHVPSGAQTHGTDDVERPMRDQPGVRTPVRIGAGAWVGSAAIVMADVGEHSIVGAGAVVTSPIPDRVIAAGVPARVIRARDSRPRSA
jgi:virginiamycin A acetyltransferase